MTLRRLAVTVHEAAVPFDVKGTASSSEIHQS